MTLDETKTQLDEAFAEIVRLWTEYGNKLCFYADAGLNAPPPPPELEAARERAVAAQKVLQAHYGIPEKLCPPITTAP